MPKRSRKPRDLNALAAAIVSEATASQPSVDDMRAAARVLGSRGGKKGGPARATKLTAEQRIAIARQAAAARWKPKPKSH